MAQYRTLGSPCDGLPEYFYYFYYFLFTVHMENSLVSLKKSFIDPSPESHSKKKEKRKKKKKATPNKHDPPPVRNCEAKAVKAPQKTDYVRLSNFY